MIFDVIVHWLHLMGAILWVGSLLFVSAAVQPILRRHLAPQLRLEVFQELGRRFNIVMWGSWSILLATGGIKLWSLRNSLDIFFGPFGKILALKLSLIAFMAALSLLHTYAWGPRLTVLGPSHPEYPDLARKMAFWGKINALAALAVVFCAALLRFNPW